MQRLIRRRDVTGSAAALERSGLHPLLARVYAGRGVEDAAELNLELGSLLPPATLSGTAEAAQLLAQALAKGERILIVGDFDADGATSTALAVTVLRACGAAHVDYLVPNRFDFGYGLSPEIVDIGLQDKPQLIITVDNGISSLSGVRRAADAGVRTLITDHHLPGRDLPEATVIVNPCLPGCHFASKNLAGVGVIFYVMLALRAELRRRNWFAERGLPEPNLGEVLDLVALGTVADVVPLDRNNRILIDAGLRRIRAGRARPGIQALLEISGRRAERLVAADLGFAVGPRLNAAGRLEDMSVGIACLLSEDAAIAAGLAGQLHELNLERRQIEQGMQREALSLLADLELREPDDEQPLSYVLYRPGWHQGVVGLLASRIKDRMHRPTIAFADAGGGLLKGSARSIPGLHIRDILDAVATRHAGLVGKFGGHAMAAGLSLEASRLDEFRQALEAEVTLHAGDVRLQAELESDGELEPAEFDMALAETLRLAGPWGQHFPEPLFDGVFELITQRIVGEKHLKMLLRLPDGGLDIDAIAFNIDTGLWPNPGIDRVRIVYRLDVNEFRGQRSLQLLVEDLQLSS
ncbi:MAG: single-stranded-DNA-specific exonuclease RecJ [Pseudomonadota bacterium]